MSSPTEQQAPQLSTHSQQMVVREHEKAGCCTCGCRPTTAVRTHVRVATRSSIFHESLVEGSSHNRNNKDNQSTIEFAKFHSARGGPKLLVEESFDSMFFFDAVENEDDIQDDDDFYPIITRCTVPIKKEVSFLDPDSMLGKDQGGKALQPAASAKRLSINQQLSSTRQQKSRPKLRSRLSSRFFGQKSMKHMETLQLPRLQIDERGYPGSLSPDEVEQCVGSKSIVFWNRLPKSIDKQLLTRC